MDEDLHEKALRARLTHVEIVELKRHAVQVLIDTLDDGDSDMSAYYRARDKIDALHDVAKRRDMTKSKLMAELERVWDTMREESEFSDSSTVDEMD